MILWKSKEDPEDRGDAYPNSAFRWTFQAGEWHLGFVHQARDRHTGEWNNGHARNYEIWITKHFRLGIQHVYYDGPHCSFSIGWIHFNWSGGIRSGWCTKCMPPVVPSPDVRRDSPPQR